MIDHRKAFPSDEFNIRHVRLNLEILVIRRTLRGRARKRVARVPRNAMKRDVKERTTLDAEITRLKARIHAHYAVLAMYNGTDPALASPDNKSSYDVAERDVAAILYDHTAWFIAPGVIRLRGSLGRAETYASEWLQKSKKHRIMCQSAHRQRQGMEAMEANAAALEALALSEK